MTSNSDHAISLKTTLQYILSDLSRYHVTDKRPYPAIFIMSPGSVAVMYYRLGHWIWYYRGSYAAVVALLHPLYLFFKRLVELYSGVSISPRAVIGKGFYVNHFGSIFVGNVVIGENCNICHEVTIGVAGRGDKRGMPVIGNRVHLAPGAKVLGKVQLEDDVAVGANAVVTKSFPKCAVVGGIPAEIISYRGSFDFVLYQGMNSDPERLENLAWSEQVIAKQRSSTTHFHRWEAG